MIKAVIFDLDGVLVTTDELHFEAWKALADAGYKRFYKSGQCTAERSKSNGILGGSA